MKLREYIKEQGYGGIPVQAHIRNPHGDNGLLRRADKSYKKHRINQLFWYGLPLFFTFIIGGFVLGELFERLFVMLVCWGCAFVIVILSRGAIPSKIDDEIANRDERYVAFVKEYVKDEREEREFRKSLLR